MKIFVNNKYLQIKDYECIRIIHDKYNNLKIYPKIGYCDRIVGLLRDLSEMFQYETQLISNGISLGGYISLESSNYFSNIYVCNIEHKDKDRFCENIKEYNVKNIGFSDYKIDLPTILNIENSEKLDNIIELGTKNWKLSRIAKVDLAILRVATLELIERNDTDVAVIISEAVSIANEYGSTQSASFINGVLDGISKEIRK